MRRRITIAKVRLENIKASFEAGANPDNYIEGTLPEVWEKHQRALDAVKKFDFNNIPESLSQLEKVWFPTAKLFSDNLNELKDLLSS